MTPFAIAPRALLALMLFAPICLRAQPVITSVEAIVNAFDPGNLSYAHGINNSGVIVGLAVDSLGRNRAFSLTGVTMTDLGTFGGPNAIAYGVNNSGVIVGAAQDGSGNYEAFSYSSATLTSLDPFGVSSAAYAINTTGNAVGYARDLSAVDIATRYFGLSLPTLGGVNGYAYDINDSGVIVGRSQTSGGIFHAFRHDGITMTDIHSNLFFTSSVAYGINASGLIVGTGFNSTSGTHTAFLFNGTTYTFIGLDGDNSYAYDVNAAGDAVGYAQNTLGQERAFFHTGGVTYDLETLAQTAGFLGNYDLGQAGFLSFNTNREFGISINDYGEIVGYGQYYDGLVTVYNRAFYMQVSAAVPEPSTYAALAGLGALGLALARRRLAAPKPPA